MNCLHPTIAPNRRCEAVTLIIHAQNIWGLDCLLTEGTGDSLGVYSDSKRRRQLLVEFHFL
jgi:hypothetical protein